MVTWNDVKTHLETGDEIPAIPEGAEVLPVVGLTFVDGYPDNIKALATSSILYIKRNPQNKFDSNAIEIRTWDALLGHLPKDVAARLAPLMDSGVVYNISVHRVRVSPDNPDLPGLDILLQRVVA